MKRKLLFLLIFVLGNTAFAQSIDDTKIVLYAPFDSDNFDDTGDGQNLDAMDQFGLTTYTKSSKAEATGDITLDGSDKVFGDGAGSFSTTAYILDTPSSYSSTGTQTITLWAKFNTLPASGGDDSMILDSNNDGTSGASSYQLVRVQSGATKLNTRAGKAFINSNSDIAAGTWYHIAVVLDTDDTTAARDGGAATNPNGTTYLYINGALEKSNTVDETLENLADLVLGARKNEKNDFFDGLMDDVLITTEPLTLTQINNIMNNGVGSQLAGPTTFVYNGSWSPSDPNNDATAQDDIEVQSGTATLTADININNITVNTGATLEVYNILRLTGNITNEGSFIFKDTATQRGELAPIDDVVQTITGDITVESYFTDHRSYRMVSSPVNTSTSVYENWQENGASTAGYGTHITGPDTGSDDGLDYTTSGNYSMFTVDVDNQQFVPVTDTKAEKLNKTVPYLLYVRGDRTVSLNDNSASSATTLRATGTLAVGGITNNYGDTPIDGQFIMFGNPYQATLDMDKVFNNGNLNVNGTVNVDRTEFYVFDPNLADGKGAYVTVNLPDGSNSNVDSQANQNLQPGQAAQVKVLYGTEAGDDTVVKIRIVEDNKSVGNAIDIKSSSTFDGDFIKGRLYVTDTYGKGGTSYDAFNIFFGESYTNEVALEDAEKPFNFSENMGVVNGNKTLVIDRRAMPATDEVIQLYNDNYEHENYTLLLDVAGLSGMDLGLYDTYEDKFIDLVSGENRIDFSVGDEDSKDAGRFVIAFNRTLGVNDVDLSGTAIFPNPLKGNILTLTNAALNGKSVDVSIFNMLGQEVYAEQHDFDTNSMQVNTSLSPGIYILKVQADGVESTHKFIKK
ncbi:MAG: hypothetical protein CL868_16520 [Cytophagaceae bacterium]|nr:hypothetical protein [Cytophagaceae bacterium]